MADLHGPWAASMIATGGLAWIAWSFAAVVTGGVGGPIGAVVALSSLALAVGLGGLVFTMDWPYRFPGGEGAVIAAIGGVFFAVGQVMTTLQGEGGLATWFVAPGVLALVGGSVLLAIGLVRARRTPPWLGVGLLVGSILFLGFNRLQLLAIPLGVVWVAIGGHLWRHPERPTDHLEPSALGR